MPSLAPRAKSFLRLLAVLFGATLLAYLVERAGPGKLLANAKTIGWGMLVVIALAGVSHIIKTMAWRLTLPGEAHKVSFGRLLGLRLVSEAITQLGFVGQMFGDGLRVSLLGSGVPVANSLSSVTLDRGLFIATGALVTIFGILAAITVTSLSNALQLYGTVFVLVLLGLLALTVVAVHRGWPLFSKTARAAGRVPWFRKWLENKESVIEAADQQLLSFHREAPRAFWTSLLLNVLAHILAIAEVYLILRFLGARVSLLGALILEALTKLLNIVGAVNPGNLGTYEGGNVVFGKLLGLTATEGLMLGLCRRVRALFWAIVGGVCLIWFSRSSQQTTGADNQGSEAARKETMTIERRKKVSGSHREVAVVLANLSGDHDPSESVLAQVGALPLVLRAILGAQSAGADRIIVVVDPTNGWTIRRRLLQTGRIPRSVEWIVVSDGGATLPMVVGEAAADGDRVSLIMADRAYHPCLHRMISEWEGNGGALELTTDGQPIGLAILSRGLALDLASDFNAHVDKVEDLHDWISRRHAAAFGPMQVFWKPVSSDLWQRVRTPEGRLEAEHKLDRWLVKPTDGIFARMNRRVSIPISRQLIKFPITPNMVSLFTLGVSLASGVYFGLGGYWNTLFAAVLSVWASILDGCDGEVARLKLQASAFGCWLETMCDYLYYLFIFAGMAIGLARSTGKSVFLVWGGALISGAVITFVVASLGRQRLSGKHPEQYLAVWQKKAESRAANPIIYLGRQLEFIIRRCFMPYAILAFALMNLIEVPVCVGAIGANIAWMVSLYTHRAFSPTSKNQQSALREAVQTQ